MKKDPYQEWLAEMRQVQPPDGFAERVMAASMTGPPAWKTPSFWGKAALFAFALAGGIGRYAIAVFLIFFG